MSNSKRRKVVAILNDDGHKKKDAVGRTKDRDDEVFWKIVCTHLELYYGYDVKFFVNDAKFLDFVLKPGTNVDATVIDFFLEFADGREVLGTSILDEIMESAEFPDTFPAIMMTDKFNYLNMARCFDHRPGEVVAKFEMAPGGVEKLFRPEGFAEVLHAKLASLLARSSGRYYHFNGGWMFDSKKKTLTNPSRIVVSLTGRGEAILEKLLAHPGNVLTLEDLGIDTGSAAKAVLSGSVELCCKVIESHVKDSPAAAQALDGFVEELRVGGAEEVAQRESIRWIARLMLAEPVFDAIIPVGQEGEGGSGGMTASELRDSLTSIEEAAPGAAGVKEIIAEAAEACRRCDSARKVVEGLDPATVGTAVAPLEEFYGSVRSMAKKSDPGKRDQMADWLYQMFFCHLFPGLPKSGIKGTSSFTAKNLRQRVIPDLRRALGDTDPSRPLISNVRNEGYRFSAEVENSNSHRGNWFRWG